MFLHLTEENNLPYLSYINVDKVNLGSGKRVIEGGGVYDSKYQLSVPIIHSDEALKAYLNS